VIDKLDRRWPNYVDNTCDGRRPVYHTERLPLSIQRDTRETRHRAGPPAIADTCQQHTTEVIRPRTTTERHRDGMRVCYDTR